MDPRDQNTKSTLKHLKIQYSPHREPHNIWKSVYPQTQKIRRAEVKSRLITRTYILQENSAKYNNKQTSSTCLLCNEEPETLEHFILSCKALENIRNKYIQSIKRIIGDIESLNLEENDSLLQSFTMYTGLNTRKYQRSP